MTTQRTQVVLIGGGYASVFAANRLRSRPDIDITIVNPRSIFVERIRLHQLVARSGDAAVDYETVLGAGIRLVVDSAERIHAADRYVELASGAQLPYDYLIYAVGSTAAVSPSVPGAAEFAYPISELEHALQLRDKLRHVESDARVVVVGAGLTGIETASELAEQGRRVSLVCGGTLGPALSKSGRRSVAKALQHLGVDVRESAAVESVRSDAVLLTDGTVISSAATVWSAGFGVPDLAVRSGLRTDALGRLLTDETLSSVDDLRIVAAGDAAAPSGGPLRMSCQAAMPLGAQAAATVLSRIAGEPPAAINQAFGGACISLGRSRGTLQIAHADDTPRNLFVGGRIGALIKEAICKATVRSMQKEATTPGSYHWLKSRKSSRKRTATITA